MRESLYRPMERDMNGLVPMKPDSFNGEPRKAEPALAIEPGVASILFTLSDPKLEEVGHVLLDLAGACIIAHRALLSGDPNVHRKARYGIEYALARLKRPSILADMLDGTDTLEEMRATRTTTGAA